MKHSGIRMTLCALLLGTSTLALAGNQSCERRAAEIELQLTYAQQHNNVHRQRGLQQALENVRRYCTDEGVRAEQLADIEAQRREIADLQAERARREAQGRADKVRKLDRKIAREQADLRELEQELRDMESDAQR